MDGNVKCALIVAGVIAFILAMSAFSGRIFSTGINKETLKKCQDLLKDIKHTYGMSKQDSEILLALVHITSSVAKCQVLSSFLTNTEAKQHLNVDLESLYTTVQNYQNTVLRGFEDMAPAVALPRNSGIDDDMFVTSG
jgi:hypothetical protein